MARRTSSKFKTTFWMTLALAVVIAAAFLLPTGCEFEPSSIGQPPLGPRPVADDVADSDGGE